MQSAAVQHNTYLNLDVILAAAHLLPQQKSIPDLLRCIKFCTEPLLEFKRLILMLEPPLQENGRSYCQESGTQNCGCTPLELPPDAKYVWFRQSEPCILAKDTLQKKFPVVAQLPFLSDAESCLLLPLPVDVPGYYALLILIRSSGTPFAQSHMALSRILTGLLTSSLSQILQREAQEMEVSALRAERDRLNILVAVTTVAMSTLKLEEMLALLAHDLGRFFAFKDIGLVVEIDETQVKTFCASSGKENSVPAPQLISKNKSFLNYLPDTGTPGILHLNTNPDLCKEDPIAQYFGRCGHRIVCVVPLILQQKCLGALLLAHSDTALFTQACLSLLGQIGQAVACAVQNAQSYAAVHQTAERLVDENAYLAAEIATKSPGLIIGQSPAIKQVLYQIALVAQSDSTVLILGETGTGKEVVAEAIHAASPRHKQRMVKMNCAAVPESLLESELFGHEKGSFTGATRQNKGRFELAHGSTLLLDEIGDMPITLQPKLLRVLQARELERIGGQVTIPIDVRVIAATNQDLLELIQEKRFREDLYYRLNVFPIHLPPLRERREDIPLLAEHFMLEHARKMKKPLKTIAPATIDALMAQDWPGNIRELGNVIERAVILSTGTTLQLDLKPQHTMPPKKVAAPLPPKEAEPKNLSMVEEIKQAVKACNGLIAGPRGAAHMLGVNRTTLNSRMKKLGLVVKDILNEPS